LVWPINSAGIDSLAGDLAFYGYALRYTLNRQQVSGYVVAKLPSEPPPLTVPDPQVAYYGCHMAYDKGWYKLSDLTRRLAGMRQPRGRGALRDVDAVNSRADFVVVERQCQRDINPDPQFFQWAARRGPSELFIRKQPLVAP
jgi:hypothetical protein